MQTITVTGSLGRDAETRTTQGGDKICSFSVASNQGYGQNKTTTWFRCSLWGKRGDSLSPYLLKGVKVAVSGEFSHEEYQGKPQFNIRVNEVELMSSRGERQGDGGNGGPSQQHHNPGAYDAALDDDVPFATCDPSYEPSIARKLVI